MSLEHAASLKGLLQPFKGKGELESWGTVCAGLRDGLIRLAQNQVLSQTEKYPFRALAVELAHQPTGAGTSFLRWRRTDRSAMGVVLWEQLIAHPRTPAVLLPELLDVELQRIALNMQISLTHSMTRQAMSCAAKMARAEALYRQRAQFPATST